MVTSVFTIAVACLAPLFSLATTSTVGETQLGGMRDAPHRSRYAHGFTEWAHTIPGMARDSMAFVSFVFFDLEIRVIT